MYLTVDPIELSSLMTRVQSSEQGGIACFLGTVRNHHGGREVARLEYSAYQPMAEAECARIVTEAENRWNCTVALEHRVGALSIGEIAVAIAVASAHRDEAFTACRYVIEEVKRRGALLKREFFAHGAVGGGGSGGVGERGGEGGDGGGTPPP